MKKIFTLFLISLAFLFAACSDGNSILGEDISSLPSIEQPSNDSVLISFKFIGDVDFSTSSMSRVTQSADDLYGL